MNDIKPKTVSTLAGQPIPAVAAEHIRQLEARIVNLQSICADLEESNELLKSELFNASEAAKIALKNIAHFL